MAALLVVSHARTCVGCQRWQNPLGGWAKGGRWWAGEGKGAQHVFLLEIVGIGVENVAREGRLVLLRTRNL